MILEARGLSKSFGGIRAVNDVSLQIEKGELSSIIGPNGAGKSTLFNLFTGHLGPDSGRVFFKNKDITNLPPYKISRMGMGRSFQRVNIFPELTVFENIQLSLLSGQGKGRDLFSQANEILIEETEYVLGIVGLADQKKTFAGLLSHGDQKRLEVGIALGGNPEILLLDEPTAGMSPEETRNFTRFIKSLAKDQALTVVFVEHDMNVVFEISDKIRVMDQGAIIATGRPEEIKANEEVQRIYLSGADKMGELEIREGEAETPSAEARPRMLEVDEIDTFYGLSHILFKVSLEIGKGEVVSVLGRNGVGKTTTLRSIGGLTPPRAGRIRFLDREIMGKPPFEIARMGIGFVPEDRIIFPDLSVKENLEIVMKGNKERLTWTLESIYQVFPILHKRQTQKGGTLSGGEQQMLTIARTLMGNPQLLLLDEPSEGLAPMVVKTLYEQLRMLKVKGMSILLAEQNSAFALLLSDRTYILEKGHICWDGVSSELKERPEIMKQYLGI